MVNQVQTLRSKMARAAETYVGMYNLPELVDPDHLLSLTERSIAVSTYCENMLSPKNWEIYYLHENDLRTVSLH